MKYLMKERMKLLELLNNKEIFFFSEADQEFKTVKEIVDRMRQSYLFLMDIKKQDQRVYRHLNLGLPSKDLQTYS